MQIVEDRRALHKIPELDRNLPKTMEYLENALKNLGCQVFSPMESGKKRSVFSFSFSCVFCFG